VQPAGSTWPAVQFGFSHCDRAAVTFDVLNDVGSKTIDLIVDTVVRGARHRC
jgi:hypothetical protein